MPHRQGCLRQRIRHSRRPRRDCHQEMPVHVIEKRPPSINLFKRVPNVMKSLGEAHVVGPKSRIGCSGRVGTAMRILYGVVGEGMGHATRSKVVCEHLSSGTRSEDCRQRPGPRDAGEERSATSWKSAGSPYATSTTAWTATGRSRETCSRLPGCSRPTSEPTSTRWPDSGPMSSSATSIRSLTSSPSGTGCPSCRSTTNRSSAAASSESSQKDGVKVDYQMTKAFVRAKLPGCDHYVVTTYFFRRRFATVPKGDDARAAHLPGAR